MFDPGSIRRCDFCENGQVTTRYKLISFRQWSDKGYVFCRAEVPIGICNGCGSQHWNHVAEAVVEDAFQQQYSKVVNARAA